MSTKQKKLQAQKIRQKAQAKKLNIVRAKLGRPDLSDKEAQFYYDALRNTSTPLEHFNNTKQATIDLVNSFGMIEELVKSNEGMTLLESISPEIKESVINANDFLVSIRADIEDAYQSNLTIIEEIDPKDKMALIASFGALNAFETITANLNENAYNLMTVIKDLTELCLIEDEGDKQ